MIRLSHFAAPAATATLAAAMFLGTGCAHDRADNVPASAMELSSGTESTSATAPHDGTVYIWDQNANKMLYVGKVDKGQMVKVDTKNDRVMLGETAVSEKRDDLHSDHHYKIYFDKADMDKDTAQHTTIMTDPNSNRTIVTSPNSGQTTVTTPPAGQTTVTTPAAGGGQTTVTTPSR